MLASAQRLGCLSALSAVSQIKRYAMEADTPQASTLAAEI